MSRRFGKIDLKRFKEKMKALIAHYKQELTSLVYAIGHPNTPWYAKVMALIVVGYAFSPIDLIPDFIPVLGYLDDMVLLPLGIALTIKWIPKPVMDECREAARNQPPAKGSHKLAAFIILMLWLLLLYVIIKQFIQ